MALGTGSPGLGASRLGIWLDLLPGPETAVFFLYPHMAEGRGSTLGPLLQSSNPNHESPLLLISFPLKGPPPTATTLAGRISIYELKGEHKNSVAGGAMHIISSP